jgi:hypothetical protein
MGLGGYTLQANTGGQNNVGVGFQALYKNTTGNNNNGIGYQAGYNLTTGSNNIAIGNAGVAAEANTIRIGTPGTQTATYLAGVNGATSTGGVAVFIDANGQLGTITSSRRFKTEIRDMGSVSEKLLQLRPVTFRYKEGGNKQYGLIAEEVAKVFPDLVQYDKQGKPFTIYYHLLTPMLLNQMKKEHAKFAKLEAENASMKAELASLKQAQAEQQKLLAKLAAFVQDSKNNTPFQKVNVVQH